MMKARHDFKSDEHYDKYLVTYFAAKAMQGLLTTTTESFDMNALATESWLIAYQMTKKRQ